MPNLQNPSSNRNRLPNRRQSVTFNFASAGLAYVCSYSLHADGSLGELFISNHKTNSAADTSARDAAITFSFAVQHGADPEAIRRALCRDSHGNPSGPLATALDIIAQEVGEMTAIILPFTRGPFEVRIEPERGGEGWMVIARSHGWLHGGHDAAVLDAREIAAGFGVSMRSSAWRNA